MQEKLKQIKISQLHIHEDVLPFLFFADGELKNYDILPAYKNNSLSNFYINGDKVYFYPRDLEPSLIFVDAKILIANYKVKPPQFRGAYLQLTPEQKGEFCKFLANPYKQCDMAYLMIFHYALERHLLYGNRQQAIEMILRLRQHHKCYSKISAGVLIFGNDFTIRFLRNWCLKIST